MFVLSHYKGLQRRTSLEYSYKKMLISCFPEALHARVHSIYDTLDTPYPGLHDIKAKMSTLEKKLYEIK